MAIDVIVTVEKSLRQIVAQELEEQTGFVVSVESQGGDQCRFAVHARSSEVRGQLEKVLGRIGFPYVIRGSKT
jgi:hypothetical protein